MFFGATAFGQAPFGAVGEAAQQIIITPASHTITLTLSNAYTCLLYTSPSPRDEKVSRMPSSA